MRAAAIALEVCEQLAKFHSCAVPRVVHGDIKPSNIHLGPQRYRPAARLRHRQDAARRLQRHRSPVRQPELLLARSGWSGPRWIPTPTCGRSARRSTKCWRARRRIRRTTRASWSTDQSKRPPRALPAACPRALRAIVIKALAPEPAERYRSALEFEAISSRFSSTSPQLPKSACVPGGAPAQLLKPRVKRCAGSLAPRARAAAQPECRWPWQ